MDGRALPQMRAGFGSGTEIGPAGAATLPFLRTSMGLLSVFSEEAVKTAGQYAIAQRRNSVSTEDSAPLAFDPTSCALCTKPC